MYVLYRLKALKSSEKEEPFDLIGKLKKIYCIFPILGLKTHFLVLVKDVVKIRNLKKQAPENKYIMCPNLDFNFGIHE